MIKIKYSKFDKNYNLVNKIYSNSANIEKNKWVLKDVILVKFLEDVIDQSEFDELEIDSIYTYEKITSLYKNFDTLSFINLITNYKSLLDQGYSNIFLKQSFNNMLSMPFFLITMTALASILVMGKLTKSNNMRYIVIGLISCITIYYLKDLSIALGKTNRIPLTLATWMPIIITGLFSSVGVLQINEK